jgi:hypothetical protein
VHAGTSLLSKLNLPPTLMYQYDEYSTPVKFRLALDSKYRVAYYCSSSISHFLRISAFMQLMFKIKHVSQKCLIPFINFISISGRY